MMAGLQPPLNSCGHYVQGTGSPLATRNDQHRHRPWLRSLLSSRDADGIYESPGREERSDEGNNRQRHLATRLLPVPYGLMAARAIPPKGTSDTRTADSQLASDSSEPIGPSACGDVPVVPSPKGGAASQRPHGDRRDSRLATSPS